MHTRIQPVVRRFVSYPGKKVAYVTYEWGYRIPGDNQVHWEGDEDTFQQAEAAARQQYGVPPVTLPPWTVA